MGCAKRNTTEHGAGFALFADRERAERVLRALRGFLPARLALSCKVRLCDAGARATAERCARACNLSPLTLTLSSPDSLELMRRGSLEATTNGSTRQWTLTWS